MEKFTNIFLTILVLFSLAFESHAYSSNVYQAAGTPVNEKVELVLYYETLCLESSKFITEKLSDVFNKGLTSIVDLQLVPWGNAVLQKNRTITCQHGEAECAFNKMEACVIELWPEVEDHFKFIQCTEQKLIDNKDTEPCFPKAEDRNVIIQCYDTVGEQLVLKHKAKTDSLKPPHTFVPWVVVNNQPLLKDYGNFIKYVCKAYKGSPVPEACKSMQLQVNQEKTKKLNESQVCYASDDQKQTTLLTLRKMLGRKIKIDLA